MHTFIQRLVGAALLATLIAPAAQADTTVSGTLRFADGTLNATGLVAVVQCPGPGYELCAWPAGDTFTDANGHYSMPIDQLDPAGTYQLMFMDWGSSYGPLLRSASFSPKDGSRTIDGQLKPWTLKVGGVQWDSPSIPLGGTATLGLTLTNQSGRALSLDARLKVEASPTGSALDSTQFQVGAGGSATPVRVDLAAGQSAIVAVPFTVPKGMPSGSGGYLTLYVGAADAPSTTYARYESVRFDVTPGGRAALSAGAPVKAFWMEQKLRERDALLVARPTAARQR